MCGHELSILLFEGLDVISMKKISLVLLAYHHLSGNIASQRFRGLIDHLPNSFSSHVLSSANEDNANELSASLSNVIAIKGALLTQMGLAGLSKAILPESKKKSLAGFG